jgi:hypothetical protein
VIDDIKAVLASMVFLLLATCQVHKYSRLLETLTPKGRRLFVGICFLPFKPQAFNNPRGYPVPFRVGIKCRQHRQSAFPGAMQTQQLLNMWCLYCQMLAVLLKPNGYEQRTPKQETDAYQFGVSWG